MNRVGRLYPLIVSLITILCCTDLPASTEDSGLDSVLKHFPGYHLLTLQERHPDVKKFVAQHFPKDNPSVVRADFNGDGNPDHALLLKNDKTGATKLVVFLCSVNAQYTNVYELDETAYAGSVYLRPVSAGSSAPQSRALDGNTLPLKLHLPAIQVNYSDKGTVVLHWNRKLQKIEEVQPGD